MISTAIIDGEYRYSLTRPWDETGPVGGWRIAWVMLNPSTADATLDDPTIRRCIAFSQAWGFRSLIVVNLFALRATDPREIRKHPDPVGRFNNHHIVEAMENSNKTVCAWGAGGDYMDRPDEIRHLIPMNQLFHLGLTKDGHPKHPLYLPSNTELQRWER